MIEGTKVCLRPITGADTEHIIRWRNSEWVRRYFIDRNPLTREIHENWLKTRVETGRVAQFIIVEKESGQDVGTVYLRDIDPDHHRAEFGIYIGEPGLRQHGLGTEATRLICAYGFETLGLHRIYLRVLADNTAAARCYEKAGFQPEGVLRQHMFDGERYHDVALMGCLNGGSND